MPTVSSWNASIERMRRLAAACSPGPWCVRNAKDDCTCGAGYVSDLASDSWGWEDPGHVIAITSYDHPPLAEATAGDEDFIAGVRTDVPRLCDELEDAAFKERRLEECLASFVAAADSRDEHGAAASAAFVAAVSSARALLALCHGELRSDA